MTEQREPIPVLMQWRWGWREDKLCARCKLRPRKQATEAKPSDWALCLPCTAEVAAEFWAAYDAQE